MWLEKYSHLCNFLGHNDESNFYFSYTLLKTFTLILRNIMTPSTTLISWREIRKQIEIINPRLFELVDSLNMSKELPLIQANYPFGCNVLENGILNLPSPNGKILPITHSDIPDNIRSELNYNSLPLGIIFENGNEVFYESEEKISSLAFFNNGVAEEMILNWRFRGINTFLEIDFIRLNLNVKNKKLLSVVASSIK